MKPTISKQTVKRFSTLTVAIVLIIATVSAVPFSALAQDEDGVTTPTPSNDPADDPYDCGDFDNRDQVEAVFEAEDDDQSGLDSDDDGIPCESIGNPNETTETDTPTEEPTDEQTETDTPTEESEDTETPTEDPSSDDEQTDDQSSDDDMSDDTEESEDTETTDDEKESEDKNSEEEKPPC